jgi:hypothetical protein
MLIATLSNAEAACGPLTMTSVPGTREVHFRDQDDSGDITPGDTRTGEMALVNADGSTAGKIHWLATVQATDTEGKPTAYDEVQVFTFDDGGCVHGQPARAGGQLRGDYDHHRADRGETADRRRHGRLRQSARNDGYHC